MTTRRLLLPALCIAAGCYAPVEQPNADDKPVTEKSNLPVSPARRAKKAKAELLVGMWKLVKADGRAPIATITFEFAQNGTFTSRAMGPTVPSQRRTGMYALNGNVFQLNIDANADEPSETSDVVIEVLTESELVVVAGPPTERERMVFKRVVRK